MLFFNYLYYRVYLFYVAKKDSIPGPSALAIVVLLQIVNLISILFLSSIIYGQALLINKGIAIILFVITLIINAIYYKKNNFDKLSKKWQNEDFALRRKRGVGVILYIVISLFLFFGLAIYLGAKNKQIG